MVMNVQMSINGVPGPNQKSSHAPATPNITLEKSVPQVIHAIKSGNHISIETTITTIANITKVRQSLML